MAQVRVINIAKYYPTYNSRKSRLASLFTGFDRSRAEARNNVALEDVSFEVPAGQCLGLIGRNGSGKSTLLRILAGIVSPSEGRVEVNGRISTILDIQSGLHPRMTGIQNIYLKGALYGLRKKEIVQRLDQIIDFSGLGEYIEHPINTYSTGMVIRLGFSIAMHMDFDILLMDEILSVGDIVFQRQCLAKIKSFLSQGKTIILATHNLGDVSAICQRVIFLKEGLVKHDGQTEMVLKDYWDICEREQNKIPRSLHPFNPENVYGIDTKEIKFRQVVFADRHGVENDTFKTGEQMQVRIGFHCTKKVYNPVFRIQFFRNDGLWVHGTNTSRAKVDLGELEGDCEILLRYDQLNLLAGDYYVSIGIWPDEYGSSFTDIAYDCRQWSYVVHIKSRQEDGGGITYNPFTWQLLANDGRPVRAGDEAGQGESPVDCV
ncbi:MAG: ABC transporter ATP-binding protein [Proteobacteria bacterium]|nr:ABC transporter ATP-binding protein [Pseudomonadota bacterium]MBU1715631.1 ABC transporter ATP-binding protein [Pseudomonadota bacterium]